MQELTPAEKEAARLQEQAEQAALPYKWTQTIGDLDVSFTVPGNFKGRDLAISIQKLKISAGVKGQEPVISVSSLFLSLRLSLSTAHARTHKTCSNQFSM